MVVLAPLYTNFQSSYDGWVEVANCFTLKCMATEMVWLSWTNFLLNFPALLLCYVHVGLSLLWVGSVGGEYTAAVHAHGHNISCERAE